MPNLMWLIEVPLIGACLMFGLALLPKKILKLCAIFISCIPFILLTIYTTAWIGSEIKIGWSHLLPIAFYLKIDSLSFLFLSLVALIVPISLFATSTKNLAHPAFFYGLVLVLQTLLIGFFTSRDLFCFTFFWESMLIPLYFLIGLWGGERKESAAIKFMIYMIAGSTFMVAAVLALYLTSGLNEGKATFDLDRLALIVEQAPHAGLIFGIFLLAFAVKTPLFPFHGWLPETYCQASPTGTILLAGLLSKAGIYGILRIGMELFPHLMIEWGPHLLTLAIVGVLYGGFAAWMQKDYKRLLAYSSFSHVNFILAGLFVWNQTAHTGAILQALNHGITITALFLCASWLESRIQTTTFAYGGLAKYMPKLCWLTLFFVAASIALPGTNNFVGELLVFLGLFNRDKWEAAVLLLTVILSAIYMLRWMQKIYFEQASPFQASWIDIKSKEIMIGISLVFVILWMGIYPSPVLKQINLAVEKMDLINKAEL